MHSASLLRQCNRVAPRAMPYSQWPALAADRVFSVVHVLESGRVNYWTEALE